MSKKSSSNRRKNRKSGLAFFLSIVLGIFLLFDPLPQGVHGASDVVYKPPRPPKDLNAAKETLPPLVDLKNIPDPFLSYLVKRGRDEAALKELEKQKQREAEQKFAKRKADAAEKLRQMQEPITDLQKLEIGQLTLTAIVDGPNKSWAMVRDESGMGYILKKGTRIGTKGGMVAKISGSKKSVIVKEPYLENEVDIKWKEREPIKLSDEVFE